MLVDARLVRERVAADDRLVELHVVAGEPGDQARRARELFGAHAHVAVLEVVAARLDRHHHLFERGVAGPLAQPVHRALDLAGAVGHTGERVRDREAEVVVAVRRDDEVAAHGVDHVADQLPVVLGNREADRVGDVERRGAVVDRDLADLAHEVGIGAVAVLG